MTEVLPQTLFEVKRGLCPGCGAPLPIDPETASLVCRHCGTNAVLERRLRKKEPEVPGAPLPLYLDVGGAEIGATGTRTPWVRSKRFRGSFVERVVCPGCGEGFDANGMETVMRCLSCGTDSVVEHRLWASAPDPAHATPRQRRREEVGKRNADDEDPETEQLIYRIVTEKDQERQIALAWRLGESWPHVNRTAVRLLPAILAAMKGADRRFQFAAAQIVCKLLCEGDPALRNGAVRSALRFLFEADCPRELIFEIGMGSAVCLKPLLDAAELATRRGDRELACAALLGVDWIFQRRFEEHPLLGEILLYRMLYLTGPVLAYALLISQRQRIGFFYPAETLLRFIDDAAAERPVLLPELEKAMYTGLPENAAEYERRRAFAGTLKTSASRGVALRHWLFPPEEAPARLYDEIARFLLPLLDDPELGGAAEKALVDLVLVPKEVPTSVHRLVADRRDALPAEVRRAFVRRVPDTRLLDPRAIPYWQGEKEKGLSPEIRKALDEWNEGLLAADRVNRGTREAFRELLNGSLREIQVDVWNQADVLGEGRS